MQVVRLQPEKKQPAVKRSSWAERARYKAFVKELKKHEADIKEIKQYIPDFEMKFEG